MTTEKIEKDDLKHFFDNLSRVLPREPVDIEVAGLDIGDQTAADDILLEGISYDAANDTIILQLGDAGEHNIKGPEAVYVEQDDSGLHSIEIACKDGHQHIVRLK